MAKFCERNIGATAAKQAYELLEQQHAEVIGVRVVDCFRRCLQCRVKPFCRIQLTTIEAENAQELVNKILQHEV